MPAFETHRLFNTVTGVTRIELGTSAGNAPPSLTTSRFEGVVGRLEVDTIVVPLWSFQETTHDCQGAVRSPHIESNHLSVRRCSPLLDI